MFYKKKKKTLQYEIFIIGIVRVMFEEKEGKKEVEQAATRYSRRRRKEKYFFFQVFHNDGVP